MDLQTFLPQLGLAGIFAVAIVKLYKDMRADNEKRDNESKAREDKLMQHLDKVSDTLEKIDERLCTLEKGGEKNV